MYPAMGKHSSKKKQKPKRRHSAEPVDGPKLLKYAALGKARRIRAALAAAPALVNYKDPDSGNTGLHQVCTAGSGCTTAAAATYAASQCIMYHH